MAKTVGYIFLFLSLTLSGIACQKGEPIDPPKPGPNEKPIEQGLPKIYFTGSKVDKKCNPKPGILLAGGGTDVDEAMKWLATNADGGDVVVLRASGGDGYNNYLYSELGLSLNSVVSIVIDSREKANKDSVDRLIRGAEALFIAGGDQSNYLAYWEGTKVDRAIEYLIKQKGVTVGGTSAGMAILSQYVYSGANGSALSTESLNNPFNSKVTIEKSFISLEPLKDFITDTHFSERDRFGRLVAFMARIALEEKTLPKAVACDEYSAVAIDGDGVATIFGRNAFFIDSFEGESFICSASTPLSWIKEGGAIASLKVRGDLSGKSKFNFKEWVENCNEEQLEWNYLNVVEGEIVEVENN